MVLENIVESPPAPPGAETLEQAARTLAESDRAVSGMRAGKPILSRLLESGQALLDDRRTFEQAMQMRRPVPPAAEWLLDNYYIVEQQLSLARRDLSAAYYYELPKLQQGPLAGFPRVYQLALRFIEQTENRLTGDTLAQFVRAYQERAPLSMGEIWAVPIMLRIGLVENLRRIMEQARDEINTQRAANETAAELLTACTDPVREFPSALTRLSRAPLLRDPTFLVQLVLRLRDQDPAVAPAIRRLEEQMSEMNVTLQDLIRVENQRRAMTRSSAGSVITSLRLLASLDWRQFFESVSLVEHALAQDPAGVYARMDFATRDRYRHVIEKLARHVPDAEVQTARYAVQLAATPSVPDSEPQELSPDAQRRRHVGWFLIGEGLPLLQAAIGHRPSLREHLERSVMRSATAVYLGAIALLISCLVGGAVALAASAGGTLPLLMLTALLTLIPLSVLAVGAVNWTLTVELEPDALPKLKLADGIPSEFRTIIVIPALIVNLSGLEYLLEHLELRFLANRDDNLHFAILGDFADAPQEHMPEDDALLETAVRRIRELNAKYTRPDAFFFLHRRRQWNPGENSWMGWERKRGKLQEFNALLRGAPTSFVVQEGELPVLREVKYVITLDADTELPLETARRLVGTIAHPLNRAVLDPVTRLVVRGYGIIQPRVDVIAPAANRSRFAKLLAGDTGLDPYASIVSNVYQDLFHRAVYIGKAIYDVDAVIHALRGRFPENLLLSHDLLEGGFLRAGFAGDIELLEDFPSGFDTYAQRQHRWVRGDWQITAWLFPRVRGAQNEIQQNPLPLIERWKIFDNLRRSLVPPAVILLLVAGWTLLPGPALGWTLLALVCILFPFARSALSALGVRPVGESPGSLLWALAQEWWNSARRGMVTVIFLLYQATLDLDAIGHALVRRALTHRLLLEWTSHAVTERAQSRTLVDYIARMWLASVLALLIAAFLAVLRPDSLILATPLLLLWFLAPSIAFSISEPFENPPPPLSAAARFRLRATARRIWAFYEDLAGAQDHWLPPDNYQLDPKPVVAHRTSPTNIGFLLLSILAAYDFGYIPIAQFAERIERVFNSLDKMERRRGHFLNWYDTTTLVPLHPQYISTVDSGNLAACLIVLQQACLERTGSAPPPDRIGNGLTDTLNVLNDLLARAEASDVSELARRVERLRVRVSALLSQSGAAVADVPGDRITLPEFHRETLYLCRLANRSAPLSPITREIRSWCEALARQAAYALETPASDVDGRLERLAQRAANYVDEMEFDFLYDPVRGAFSVGYNEENHRRDDSYYDLFASEARLTSYLTIARGEIPVSHWFRMSRPLTRIAGRAVLLSWSGTMFEYLMPPLFLRDYMPSLLRQTGRAVIREQIAYAARFKMPWGISESGFYAFDYQFNYQYRAFGVPELSLKREFADTRVIAPYATFLALPYAPQAAWNNLNALARLGGAGSYGYYEALDFTPEHLPAGQHVAIVRSYMAHHQGMSLVALDNFLNANIIKERFHREPTIAAAELLLQERVPRHAPLLKVTSEEKPLLRMPSAPAGHADRQFSTPHTYSPRAHILSNGEYSVMLTNAGGGYSAWSTQAPSTAILLTRWRADATLDAMGSFCYIHDVESERVWSNTYQPTCAVSEEYHVTFAGDKVEFLRRDTGIETTTQIFVAPDANAEIRRMTLANAGSGTRTLELTTYAEVVLDASRRDAAHPAFGKLFIESEFVTTHNALLIKRRPMRAEQPERWAVHFLLSDSPNVSASEHETDRARFLGRGRTTADPAALYAPLSNSTGATLDPIMSLRTRVRLAPGSAVTLAWVTGAADSREGALALCDKFLDLRDSARAEDSAGAATRVELRHLGITPADATLFQRLASRILFPDPQLRAGSDVLARNSKGQAGLWAYGISGDYPIVLIQVTQTQDLDLVRQALLAHEFWRRRGFHFDLVIVDEHATSYQAGSTRTVTELIATSPSRPWLDKPGGIFLRNRDLMAVEDYVLLQTVACVVLRTQLGNLADQINLSARHVPAIGARARRKPPAGPVAPAPAEERQFHNGIGGFSEDGREYVIRLEGEQWAPAPWTNVISNPGFGCLVTESGLGMTWMTNSQLNKLTPWSNDPVTDPPSEAIYLQDVDTGELWTPTPLPIREPEPYTIRHGAGYSTFEHSSHQIAQSLRVSVTTDEPVKLLNLSLRNLSHRVRRVRATYYAEWLLGTQRDETRHFILAEYDQSATAVLARNVYSEGFGAQIAFAAAAQPLAASGTNRAEFLGRNGSYALPAALTANAPRLSQQTEASSDSCAVLQIEIELQPQQETEIVFMLGQGQHRTHARALIQKYRDAEARAHTFAQLTEQWDSILGAVRIKTPDAGMDLLVNRWLLVQTLACRLWGRAAFYQAGGAYGFRDQLQDVMALVLAAPELARRHIVYATAHQFPEGDVQHWWHPDASSRTALKTDVQHDEPPAVPERGVRTRISDDYLWLPYAAAHYVRVTGDANILDEQIPFITMPRLEPDQEEIFDRPVVTGETASLYEHCVRALDHGLQFGAHGLPLMGTGDWNDGMNRVGYRGRGESVWLGWFLYDNLQTFARICESRGDAERADKYRTHARALASALEQHGWDGEWYRRAYFDDGTPLGAQENAECKIDAIAQAWAVISGAAPAGRQEQALRAVREQLVRDREGILLLLTPPFEHSQPNPGYIQGYLAGIRENGGQYTHGALWVVLAHLLRGDGNGAYELLRMLNPLNHSLTPQEVEQYKVEPYVVAADVYSHPQHRGRGGWTWYTGSAGWMYRIVVEHMLGLNKRGDVLILEPCIPAAWSHYEMVYRHGATTYEIVVENPQGVSREVRSVELDGQGITASSVPLTQDGGVHRVRVILGE